jgi:hypothetical protein
MYVLAYFQTEIMEDINKFLPPNYIIVIGVGG